MARPEPTPLYDRALRALLDRTRCPACTAALSGPRCAACGLDVTAPGAGLLWEDSVAAAEALRRRAQRIAAMRAAARSAAPRAAAPRPAAPSVPTARTATGAGPAAPYPADPWAASPGPAAPVARPAPLPQVVLGTGPAPAPGPAAAPTPERAPWRVQTVLQVVGAALLVAACVTFLVFAWDVLTLGARAAAVGTVTLVVLGVAALLRARGLPQGAEAVGALGAALLLLDAWALRATGAVVVGTGPGQATVSLVACAAVLATWGRAARLRAGTVAAAVLLPVVPLVWLPRAGTVEHAALLLVASATLTLVRAAAGPGHRTERTVLRAAAWGAAVPAVVLAAGAGVVRTALGAPAWSAAVVLLAACVVLVLQARVEERVLPAAGSGVEPAPAGGPHPATTPAWWSAAGVTGAVGVATAGAAVARAAGADGAASWHVAALTALVAGLVLHRGARLVPHRLRASVGLAAATAAAGTAAWVVLAALVRLGAPTATRPVPLVAAVTAVVALAAAGLLAGTVAARRDGAGVRAAGAARATAAVLASVAAPLLVVADRLGAAPAARSAVAVAGLAAVVAAWVRVRAASPTWRRPASVGTVAAAATAVPAGASSPAATAAALLLAAAVALHARTWSRRAWADAASTGTAGGLVAAAAVVGAVGLGVSPSAGAAVAAALTTVPLLARATRPAAGALERSAALVVAAVLVLTAWAATALGDPGPGAWGQVAPCLAAASALVVVAALLGDAAGAGRGWVGAGAGAAAPVAALAVATVHDVLGRPAPGGAALVVAGVGAASVLASHLLTERGGRSARVAAEAAGWLVVACAVPAAATAGTGPAVAVLAAAAATAGGWAVHRDRHRAWWAAWALGTAAWCVALSSTAAVPVEPYVVPPGIVLVAVGAARLRRASSGAAPLVGGGAALVSLPAAVLPAVLQLGDRWVDRAAVTVVLGTAVLVAAALIGRRTPGPADDSRRTAAVLTVVAALLAALGPARRALAAAADASGAGGTGGPPEVWAVVAAALLAGTAVVAHRTWPPRRRAPLLRVGPWVVLAAAAVPVLLAVAVGAGTADATTARVRLAVLGLVAVTLCAVGAADERRIAPAAPAPGVGPGARLADLGLALVASVALVAPVALPDAVADAPAVAVALLAAATSVPAARRSSTAPAPWVALAVLALLPTPAVRDGALRPAAWVLVAALLLVLARAARVRGDADGPVPDDAAPDHAAPDRPARLTSRVSRGALSRTLAAAAGALVLLGPWVSAVTSAAGSGVAGTPPDVRAVELPAAAGAVLAGAAWASVRPRRGPGRRSPNVGSAAAAPRVVPSPPALAVVLVAVPVLLAVDGTAAGAARAVAVLAAGAALAWVDRTRGDAVTGTAVAVVAGVTAALRDGPEPADVPLVAVGLLTVALGARWLTRDERRGSWSALGAPVAVALGVPVVTLLVAPTPARSLTALVLALAATVVGAARRLQAPLLLGAVAALTTAAVLLTPVASGALARVDGWVLLGVGGAAVLGLGLTYERRVREAREAVRVVAAMR
ncbi:SCO7613 C-terminal domain-containing membrane protein [Cellulomonas telluris]|uniref:SCO7613 C-terminal domain-containing membrane protein n=1 Tax=Cellulomonas telluris TaxID=2306636 RepID=UPI0010A8877B|nr:hypothetical protein [Cellulomonas telluris]